MIKLIIETQESPTPISFDGNQPDWNVNPNTKVEITLPEKATVTVNNGHVALEGVKRPR